MTTQITRRTMLKQACGITLGGAAAVAGLSLKDAVAQRTAGTGIPVTGVSTAATDLANTGLNFDGVLSGLTATLDRQTGLIDIVGSITGLLDGVTEVLGTFTSVLDPAAGIIPDPDGVCEILTLDLGPLHLDVLGLVIDLNEINLDVTAEPGPGNLLGNLLCAITGLLDNPAGALNGLTNLLNRVFALLG